jgi:hypothetical protein
MSSTSRGEDLETRVFAYFKGEVESGRFFAKPECCAIFQRRKYYSRDRRSDIEFDVVIELRLPGSFRRPSSNGNFIVRRSSLAIQLKAQARSGEVSPRSSIKATDPSFFVI